MRRGRGGRRSPLQWVGVLALTPDLKDGRDGRTDGRTDGGRTDGRGTDADGTCFRKEKAAADLFT